MYKPRDCAEERHIQDSWEREALDDVNGCVRSMDLLQKTPRDWFILGYRAGLTAGIDATVRSIRLTIDSL